MKTSQLLN